MGLEIIGAGLQHRASKKAASAQKEAAYEANQTARDLSAEQMDLYKQIYDEQKAQQAPYLQQCACCAFCCAKINLFCANFSRAIVTAS